MKTILCLLIGMMTPLTAQPPIWTTVFTNRTTTGTSSNIKNSGQTQHILYGTVTSNAPSTCINLFNNVLRIEGSYDNSTFTAISPDGVADSAGNFFIYGNGAFPFIRANLIKIDTGGGAASCKVNVFYTGEFPTVPVESTVVTKAFGELVYTNSYAGAGLYPVAGSFGSTTSTNSKFVIMFADVYYAGTGLIVLQEYTDSSCTTIVSGVSIMWATTAPAGGVMKQFPRIPSGYYKAKQNNSTLCLSLPGASVGDVLIKYRYEE
jgi:hypothetical protein